MTKHWRSMWPDLEVHEVTMDEVKDYQRTYSERTGWKPSDPMPVGLRISGELSSQIGRRRMWQLRALRLEGMLLMRAYGLDLEKLLDTSAQHPVI